MGNDPPEELNDKNSKAKARKFVLKSLNGLKTITEKWVFLSFFFH